MSIYIVIIFCIGILFVLYKSHQTNNQIGIYIRKFLEKNTLTKYVLLYNAIQILLTVIYQNLSSANALLFTAVFPLFWIICIVLLVIYLFSQIPKYKLQGISIIELIQLLLLTPLPFLWIVRNFAD